MPHATHGRSDAVRRLGGRASGRVHGQLFAVAQQSLAAGIAWAVAHQIDAAGQQPFFAPIAAVVALNTDVGGRGRQALRLLAGAVVGVVVGAVALDVLGTRLVALPVAVIVAMLISVAVGGARVTLAQSAAGAILTVGIPYGGEGGLSRLMDALIGVGVALVVSQVLFSPDPRRMLTVTEAGVIAATGDLVEALDGAGPEATTARREAVREAVAAVHTARRSARNVNRHTARWSRSRHRVDIDAPADRALDDLADAVVFLSVCVADASSDATATLRPHLGDLAARLRGTPRAASPTPLSTPAVGVAGEVLGLACAAYETYAAGRDGRPTPADPPRP